MPSPRSWIALLLLGLSLPAAAQNNDATPAANATAEQTQSLDGKWDFTTNASALTDPSATWDSLEVPGNWDVQPAYKEYRGKAFYRRTFTVPADWKGKHVRVCFGAVNQEAWVRVNDHVLGKHIGGYTPFEFDVTDLLHYGGDNTIIVSADNAYHRGAWWPWGGISRSVSLVATGEARLVWQHITATPDLQRGDAAIEINYKIANDSNHDVSLGIASTLDKASDVKIDQQVTLKPHSQETFTAKTSLPKADVQLWDFDHPNLYTLTTRLTAGDKALFQKADRFGIRKVEIKPEGLFLNGEQVRVVGFNRVSDSNQYGNTEPDVLVHADVDMMKSAGANFARLMHTPHAPNLLDYLDEKGMMIIAEIPVWGGGDPNVKKDNPLTEQWLTEMINRDYNHPCIVGWSPGNELRNHYAYVKSMLDFIRTNLDSSRLLTHTSNSAVGASPAGDPVTVSDFAMNNSYSGFAHAATNIHMKWPDKPIFFSEWGTRQFGDKLESKIPNFDKSLEETVKDHPYVIGISIWTFNDYRNGFKKIAADAKPGSKPEPETRTWGVVDVDRHPKAAYQQVRAAFSPVHALTVANGKVRIEPRSHDEIPSYALRGYQVKWESGGTGGTVSVPDLKPGDPAWETSIPATGSVTVHLITPTGYDVTDASSQ